MRLLDNGEAILLLVEQGFDRQRSCMSTMRYPIGSSHKFSAMATIELIICVCATAHQACMEAWHGIGVARLL